MDNSLIRASVLAVPAPTNNFSGSFEEDIVNIRSISTLKPTTPATLYNQDDNPAAFRQRQDAISRRQFARTAAATAVIGTAGGSGLWTPGQAEARASFAPVPLPGGSPILGGYHVFGPAAFDPIDAEPSTITNHNGFVGLAYISGTVTQINTKTGDVQLLPFVDSDMRFICSGLPLSLLSIPGSVTSASR